MRKALLDACVLAPFPLYDTLLRLADAGLFSPAWSQEILDETERTIITKLDISPSGARRRISQMNRAFDSAMVEGFEKLIPIMANHPKDRHVLAAAVHCGASIIVTANIADFPPTSLTQHGITATHPDQFLLKLLESDPETVIGVLREQRNAYANPAFSVSDFHNTFSATAPKFAEAAELLEATIC
jgi:predicted nucleic acid-binding protein